MSSQSRSKAYAAINICWKQISPDGDREERLAWVAEYLGLDDLESLTDLSDEQLGDVTGELKRLTGSAARRTSQVRQPMSNSNVLHAEFRRESDGPRSGETETIFLASEEQVYTLEKLDAYIGWMPEERDRFLRKRFKGQNFRRFTFKQATAATNVMLRIAAHKDLRLGRADGEPITRVEINKYIPKLKAKLSIDQR
jgi:hypothetical protein